MMQTVTTINPLPVPTDTAHWIWEQPDGSHLDVAWQYGANFESPLPAGPLRGAVTAFIHTPT